MIYNAKVQLGRLAIPERIVSLEVAAKDEVTAEGLAMRLSYEMFQEKFGKDNPILSKLRTVVALGPKDGAA